MESAKAAVSNLFGSGDNDNTSNTEHVQDQSHTTAHQSTTTSHQATTTGANDNNESPAVAHGSRTLEGGANNNNESPAVAHGSRTLEGGANNNNESPAVAQGSRTAEGGATDATSQTTAPPSSSNSNLPAELEKTMSGPKDPAVQGEGRSCLNVCEADCNTLFLSKCNHAIHPVPMLLMYTATVC